MLLVGDAPYYERFGFRQDLTQHLVMPGPVEAALSRHRAVEDCAVFGLADDHLGQRVVAAVVADPAVPWPTLDEVREFLALSLDPTAAPRELHFIDELPRLASGKLDRPTLRERYADGAGPGAYGW